MRRFLALGCLVLASGCDSGAPQCSDKSSIAGLIDILDTDGAFFKIVKHYDVNIDDYKKSFMVLDKSKFDWIVEDIVDEKMKDTDKRTCSAKVVLDIKRPGGKWFFIAKYDIVYLEDKKRYIVRASYNTDKRTLITN